MCRCQCNCRQVLVHFHDLLHCCHALHVCMCGVHTVDTNLVQHVATIYFVQLCNRCIIRFTTVNVHLEQAHLQNTPSSTQQLNSLSLNIIHLVIYLFLVKCRWSLVLVANMSTNSRRGKKVNPSVSEGWCISCSLGTSRHSDCQTWEEGGKRWEGEASPVEAPLPTPAHRKKRCSDCGGEMRWVSRPGLMSRTPNPLHTRDAFPLIRHHMLKMGRPYKWLPQKRKQAWKS